MLLHCTSGCSARVVTHVIIVSESPSKHLLTLTFGFKLEVMKIQSDLGDHYIYGSPLSMDPILSFTSLEMLIRGHLQTLIKAIGNLSLCY